MTETKCWVCNQPEIEEIKEERLIETKGVEISVADLSHFKCRACGAEWETPDQIDHNADLVRLTFIREKERIKEEKGLLTGREIRGIRKSLHLTQQHASKLFGGGPTAFSKYENEEIIQNLSMDRLLRIIYEVPDAYRKLKEIAGEISPQTTSANSYVCPIMLKVTGTHYIVQGKVSTVHAHEKCEHDKPLFIDTTKMINPKLLTKDRAR
ncbi:MAG: type II toxin-antitoxin system MqsA family antitoxin [Sedimenticola sp.]